MKSVNILILISLKFKVNESIFNLKTDSCLTLNFQAAM